MKLQIRDRGGGNTKRQTKIIKIIFTIQGNNFIFPKILRFLNPVTVNKPLNLICFFIMIILSLLKAMQLGFGKVVKLIFSSV
jgi:hypothetical protein